MQEKTDDGRFSVLVGWYAVRLGDKMVLKMQGSNGKKREVRDGPELTEFYLTRNQAAQLGHYLFRISEQTPPGSKKRGWLARKFGG